MRKFRSKIRKTVKEIIIVAALFAAVAIFYLASIIPSSIYLGLGVISSIGFIIWVFIKFQNRNETYIDERGYVFLVLEKDPPDVENDGTQQIPKVWISVSSRY